jgi:hypothetical protein
MENKILIYDDACPLCVWYTNAFVKYGLLQVPQRKAFSELSQEQLQHLDIERACQEIPLLNTETLEVKYGIDAMLEVLNTKFSFIKRIGTLPVINLFLKKLYKLISFNRKGIIAKKPTNQKFNCTPSYDYNYKIFFIVLSFIVASLLLLFAYKPYFNKTSDAVTLTFGLLTMVAITTKNKSILETIMQLNLQLLISTVILLPVIVLQNISSTAAFVYLIIMSIYILKQFRNRIIYLKYFINSNI